MRRTLHITLPSHSPVTHLLATSRSHFRCALHRRGAREPHLVRERARGCGSIELGYCYVVMCVFSLARSPLRAGTLLHVPFDIPRRVGWHALVPCLLHLSRCPTFVCARLGHTPLNLCTLPLVSTWVPVLHVGALVALGHSHRTSKSVFRHQVSTTHQGHLLALVQAQGHDTLPYAKGI